MTEEKLVPELRFPEFEGEWEKKRLGRIFKSISSGKTKSNIEKGIYPLYGSTGLIKRINKFEYSGHKILIARVGENTGLVNHVTGEYGVTDNTLMLDKYNEDITNIYFFYYYLYNYDFRPIKIGTGQPLITGGDLKKIKINIPIIKEQKKIGDFFSKIDKKIELQEELIENLEEQKKGLMQKIFNQEVRFKDENGKDYPEWEEIKLKHVKSSKRTISNINSWYLEIGDVDTKFKTYRVDKEKELIKTAKPSQQGTILISTVRPTRGAIVKLKENLYVSSAFFKIYIENIYLREFVFQRLNQESFFIDLGRFSTGSTYPTVNKNDIWNYKIEVPINQNEQNKIAILLSSFDKKISLEKENLENYKKYKKGLMQRMFI